MHHSIFRLMDMGCPIYVTSEYLKGMNTLSGEITLS